MAFQKPKINTNWLLLGIAIALGIGAVVVSNHLIKRRMAQLEEEAHNGRKTESVVVAKRDMARGESITADAMAVREVPVEFLHADAIRPNQFGALERQRLAVPMKRGDVLLPVHSEGNGGQVFSATLKKGMRALTFEVDAVNSISGMLRPGDRIDLIYSAKPVDSSAGAKEDVTAPLLSNVAVLATDQHLSKRDDESGKDRSFSTITLEVSPFDADRIIVAKSSGRLTAVLRHPEDEVPNGTRALTASNIGSHGDGKTSVGPSIEYIVGGGGGGVAQPQFQLERFAAAMPFQAGRGGAARAAGGDPAGAAAQGVH
ncbi:Flp pilus assembly protein CpaB [Ideonella azotifigens]|uniref:SAF domain-containing protein n=1 Tax=Ideonella azotifigens TaxID=513160 RepID=A0ABP3V1E5_9BURK|nr:Flp pilus assembly protein CpaB [Ideonella azotifigens]MCD2340012.1 Flp pilus assembly protein CpaB [Ideonella azotifigens]